MHITYHFSCYLDELRLWSMQDQIIRPKASEFGTSRTGIVVDVGGTLSGENEHGTEDFLYHHK